MFNNPRRMIALCLFALCTTLLLFVILTQPVQAGGGGGCYARIERTGVIYPHVQSALDNAQTGDLIQVCGTCSGVYAREGVTQTAYISNTVTIRGGYDTTFTEPPDPIAHPTTLDAQGKGRVVYITGAGINPTIEGLRITGGSVPSSGGGGIMVWQSNATLTNTVIVSNTAATGAAIELWGGAARINNSTISNNVGHAGTVYLYNSRLWLNNNSITDNQVTVYDKATRVESWWLDVFNKLGGAGGTGGCLFVGPTSEAWLSHNRIEYNQAMVYGGALYLAGGTATLKANKILNNTAGYLGGASFSVQGDNTYENNVISGNHAPKGAGLFLSGGSFGRVFQNTISGNDSTGVELNKTWDYLYGPSGVIGANNIIVSHTVGITVATNSLARLEGTLWGTGTWANGIDWGGEGTIITGTINIWGIPAFVNPVAGDYHISSTSAARDVANEGLSTDMDGEVRPQGLRYDIGADEFRGPTSVGLIVEPTNLTAIVRVGESITRTFTINNPTTETVIWEFGPEPITTFWTVDSSGGSIPPGGSQTVTITFKADPMFFGVGTHYGMLDIVVYSQSQAKVDLTMIVVEPKLYLPLVLRSYGQTPTQTTVVPTFTPPVTKK